MGHYRITCDNRGGYAVYKCPLEKRSECGSDSCYSSYCIKIDGCECLGFFSEMRHGAKAMCLAEECLAKANPDGAMAKRSK